MQIRRQFAWIVKPCLLGKIRKKYHQLSSAEFAERMIMVNYRFQDRFNSLDKIVGLSTLAERGNVFSGFVSTLIDELDPTPGDKYLCVWTNYQSLSRGKLSIIEGQAVHVHVLM